jgi:hypothetical protein
MKKILCVITACIAFYFPALSQENSDVLPASHGKNVFLELGGNGGLISANYDMRFSRTGKGLGFRVGIGYVPPVPLLFVSTPSIITFPVGLNYLAGKGPHYFEGGLGVTVASAETDYFGDEENMTGFAFVPNIAYRYQPLTRRFTGRVSISPFIGSGGVMFWAGLSGGFRF